MTASPSPNCTPSSYGSNPVAAAALWLATGGADRSTAIVPQLIETFGLTPLQACHAIRDSRLHLARAL